MPGSLRHIAASVVLVGAWVSLVIAPQGEHLANVLRYVPQAGTLSLNLLCGLLVGFSVLSLLRGGWQRWGEAAWESVAWPAALCHLPLYLLWWPAVRGVESSAFRLWVPLAVASVALLLTAALVLRRAVASGVGAPLGVFVVTLGVALGASSAAAFNRAETAPSFPVAVLWGLYLLLAWVGWGVVVNRILVPGQRLDWGQRAAWGMALSVVVGGLLNLVWAISPAAVLLFLATGAGVWAGELGSRAAARERWARHLRAAADEPLLAVVVVLVVGLALLQLAGSVAGTVDTASERPAFDLHDDCQAYLVFPTKMLQLGSMGAEPFEARRMLSLGGQSWLQALVLVTLPHRALHLVDQGVALVIILGLVLGGARRWGVERSHTVLLLLLVVALPHLEMRGNTSSVLTGVVLLLSWFRCCADGTDGSGPGRRSAALVGLVAGALCSLKSTFIPAAVVFFAVSSLLLVTRSAQRRGAWRETGMAVVLIGACVLPWMVSVFESSHTPLYPVLGKGFYGGGFTDDFAAIAGNFALPPVDTLRALVTLLVPMWPVLLLLVFVRDAQPRAPATALGLAAVATVLFLVLMGDAELSRSLSRYAFPVQAAAVLGLAMSVFRPHREGPLRNPTGATVAGLVVVVAVLAQGHRAAGEMYDQVLRNAAAAVRGEGFVDPTDRHAAFEMSAAVPDEQAMLTTIPYPFLLDFRARRTLIMSLPGMASLPPGLPVYAGGEAMAGYLLGHSIRYLAYGGKGALRDLLTLTEARIMDHYPRSKMRWVMLRYHQRYRRGVLELAGSRKRLYSDPSTVLLDLATRAFTVIPRESQHGLENFVDGVWTTGDAAISNLGCEPCGRFLVLSTFGWHPYRTDRQRLQLEVLADGHRLELVRTAPLAFVFRMPPGLARVDTVRIRSAVVEPGRVGTATGAAPLGVDVRAIEISDDPSIADRPIQIARLALAGMLRPERVWSRTGFYPDFNWTDGDALITGLSWPVGERHRSLVLTLFPVHPFGSSWRQLDVRVEVNGLQLEFVRAEGRDLHFALYDNLHEISSIRLRSSTFVPRELRGGDDDRTLGIPIKSLRLE